MAHHLEPVPPLRSASSSTRTLSIAEVAELVGISRTMAYGLAESVELPTVRLGRRILVRVNQLAEVLGTPPPMVL